MANFWDTYNQAAQQQASQGANHDWSSYEKLQKIKELSDKKKKEPEQPAQKGNFLTSLIPSLGGTGGALGGAAAGAGIGTALLPGIGTAAGGLLGAILGGAGGSALGKVGENAIEGETNLGKGVAGEALMGGVTSLPLTAGLKLAGVGGKLLTGAGKGIGQGIVDAGAKVAPGQVSKGVQIAQDLGSTLRAPQSSQLLKNTGNKLQNASSDLLSSQSNMTRPQMRQAGVNVQDTFGNINTRTGLTKLDDMATVAGNITGKQGSVFDDLTRNAIGNAGVKGINDVPGVAIGDLRSLATNLLTDKAPLVAGPQRDNILTQIKNASIAMNGGSKGSLNALANPSDALDQANNFEKMAASLTNKFTTTPEHQQLADVYHGLASHIKQQLYNAPGVSEGLALAKPEALQRLAELAASSGKGQAGAYDSLSKELANINDIASLRSSKKDFVDLSKIDKATAQATNGAAQNLGDSVTGLGKYLQRPTNLLALPVNAATPQVGGMMAKLAQITQGRAGQAGERMTQSPIGLASREFVGSNIADMQQPQPQAPTGTEPSTDAELQSLIGDVQGSMQPDTQVPSNPFGMTSAEAAQGMVKAMAAGDTKAATRLQEIYGMVSKYEADQQKQTTTTGYGKPTAQQFSLAQSGMSALNQLQQLLQNDPNLANNAAIPGQDLPGVGGLISNVAGTGQYKALAKNVIDAIARARTGAAMTQNEEGFYNRMLPQPGDNAQTIQTKLAELQGAFQPFIPQQGGATTLEELLAAR